MDIKPNRDCIDGHHDFFAIGWAEDPIHHEKWVTTLCCKCCLKLVDATKLKFPEQIKEKTEKRGRPKKETNSEE